MKHDFQIHRDEFRLRVLLTNKCDKKCTFCLNDFQKKYPGSSANPMDLMDCIRAYGSFMKSIGEESIITFSGGEPGIYPFLTMILRFARGACDTVKVVTNGNAYIPCFNDFVDKWHVSVTERRKHLLDMAKTYFPNTVFQTVVTDQHDYDSLRELVDFYHSEGFLVKLFVDFYSKHKLGLQDLTQQIMDSYQDRICTRFTGVQQNRGPACEGCKVECVTLKALWYFPDGTSSTCPQGQREIFDDDSWDETVEKAYNLHKVERS